MNQVSKEDIGYRKVPLNIHREKFRMRSIDIALVIFGYLLLPLLPVSLFLQAASNELSLFISISRVAGI